MRVLWLTKGLGRGGAERLIVDSAALMDKTGIDVTVAYLLPWKSDLADELANLGASVTCLGSGWRAIGWPLRLALFLRRERFDVIHTHAPLPAALARVVDREAKFIHTEHNVWGRYRVPTRVLNALTYRRNERVVAVSEGVAQSIGQRWLRRGVHPEVVIHGLGRDRVETNTSVRSEMRSQFDWDSGEIIIGCVANFTAKKDHATLLRSFAATRASGHHVRLVLIGSGPLEPEMRSLAIELGVGESVSFLGKRADVPALLSALDVFVLSSRFEGLPIALLEAMAAGLAIVATSVGGIPEAVTDGESAVLIEPGNEDALAAALRGVAESEAVRTRLGRGALEKSHSFDLREAVATIESMYLETSAR